MELYTERNMKTNSEFADRRRKLIGGRREKNFHVACNEY